MWLSSVWSDRQIQTLSAESKKQTEAIASLRKLITDMAQASEAAAPEGAAERKEE